MSNEFNFAPFEDAGGKFSNYIISIGTHMGFGFNAGFYKKENIKDYIYVFLSYDKSNNAIGFHFTNDSTIRGVCKITHGKGKKSGSVVVRSFFAAHSIDAKEYAGKYEPKEYSDPQIGKLFYIVLKKKKAQDS